MSVTKYQGHEPPCELKVLLNNLPIEDQLEVAFENDPVFQNLLLFKKCFNYIKDHCTSALSNFCPFTLVTKNDHPAFALWIKEILTCRSLFQKTLPAPDCGSGLSKGIFYTIKKTGQVVGYLLGTLHNLLPGKAHIVDLHPKVLKKLDKCPVLLTEIKNQPNNISTEKTLVDFAQKRGICQLGIDDVDYRKSINTITFDSSEEGLDENEKRDWEQYQDSYYKGDHKALEKNPLSSAVEEDDTANQRNNTMASHIIAFLNTGVSKIYSAVGTNHLINSSPIVKTIPDHLRKEGYEVIPYSK